MRVCLVLVLIGIVAGDIYMHNPRGSNNRLNENTANRRTNNRVFDSQVRPINFIMCYDFVDL